MAFTKENAAILGRQGATARWTAPKPAPEPPKLLPIPQPIAEPDIYQASRIIRVRKQIDLLSDLLETEQDPNKLDRLASAIDRLSDLERVLSGRPLPGSKRPAIEKPENPKSRGAWLQPSPCVPDASPVPIVDTQAKPDGWEYD